MLKNILIGIAALVAAAVVIVLGLAAMKPDAFSVQRSIAVNAPPEKIIPYIEDFHRWTAWSPYEAKDPAMKRTFSGAPKGKGAIYEWDGDKNVGKGRMEILDVSPSSKVKIKLDFISPFEGHNVAEFAAMPKGAATDVTWTMSGPAPFMSKIMQTVMNLDKMIGDDFEAGLRNLKAAAEKQQ